MKKFWLAILGLLGFAISTSCRVEYGTPEVEYDEKQEYNPENTERFE